MRREVGCLSVGLSPPAGGAKGMMMLEFLHKPKRPSAKNKFDGRPGWLLAFAGARQGSRITGKGWGFLMSSCGTGPWPPQPRRTWHQQASEACSCQMRASSAVVFCARMRTALTAQTSAQPADQMGAADERAIQRQASTAAGEWGKGVRTKDLGSLGRMPSEPLPRGHGRG